MRRIIRFCIADLVLLFLFWKEELRMGFTRKELVSFMDCLLSYSVKKTNGKGRKDKELVT